MVEQPKRRRPLVAAALSALVPGAGQLYARDPYRAAIVFAPTVLVVAGVYGLASRGTFGLAELLVQPDVITRLLIANAVVLAWRLAASIDAFVIASRGQRRTTAASAGLVALLGIMAIPQLIGWSYGAATISALNAVFVASPDPISDPGPFVVEPRYPEHLFDIPDPGLIDIPEVDPRSMRNAIFRKDFGDPDAIAALGNILSPATPVAPFVPYLERVDKDRLTILVVGGDAGPGREGLRTDSTNVVSIDLRTGAVAMFGLPRNLKEVPLPENLSTTFIELEKEVREYDLTDADLDGYPDTWVDLDGDLIPDEPEFESCECFPAMLNEVYGETHDRHDLYPDEVDPGLAALRDVVSNLLDLHIDYYVMVEMAGFVRTVDAIGGIDVYVKRPYHVTVSSPEDGQPKASVSVEVGMNHLNGLEALAYARWRRGSSDYDRMGRQRCVIRAAATQADTITLIRSFPKLLDMMKTYVTTDIPISILPDLVKVAGTIDREQVATIGFVPPRYNDGRTPKKYPIPDVGRIRAKVRDVLANGVTGQTSTGVSECDPPAEG